MSDYRASFEQVEHITQQLHELSPTPEVFCDAWPKALSEMGWDEDTYFQHLDYIRSTN